MREGNKFFDDLSKLMNDAAGVADGVRREIETAVKSQMERVVNDLDLVKREEFEAVKAQLAAQNEEIEQLRKDIDALKK
ncbi:accessory factor UbiK family protein [Maritalea sp. S77]|jgi:BMFP domain-containing protein YqiC|uniref:accessory factor UbiK family protein n=1 Tax=Maritalea sp. S77 TaxID=3415125 RepID=UPI003C7D899F